MRLAPDLDRARGLPRLGPTANSLPKEPAETDIYPLSLHDALPIFFHYRGYRPSEGRAGAEALLVDAQGVGPDRKSTRLNSSHVEISYAAFRSKKKTEPPRSAEGRPPPRAQPRSACSPTPRRRTGAR